MKRWKEIFQKSKLRLVWAWIEIHREALLANWELAKNGSKVFSIKPNKTFRVSMVELISVKPLDNYILELEFKNGESRLFDVTPYLDFGIFKELRDKEYFNRVTPYFDSIIWQNGQDFSLDTLYLKSTPVPVS